MLPDWVTASLDTMATLFVVAIGLAVVAVVVLFVIDVTQSRDTVRRNYPVIGRFRYLFQELGEFFRQYFFAMDREELPFNRAQREWIDHASKGESDTVPFGSTKRLDAPGTPIFINAPFPPLEQGERVKRTIGAGCKTPFDPRSFFNISGMSYGAISKPAIKALSRGAAKAGCWLNTGEGGLTTYHLDSGADIVFQIGTAKYGVRDEEGNLSDDKLAEVAGHKNVRMFEVKLAQGAKPGKGGILPGGKVNAEVAQVRG
ncbi:MAG: glutamate synthase-related protein, partial [Pseudomonadota bacterium]